MKRGFRIGAWILLALAVLAVAVIVPVGALRAHGTTAFNWCVGLATVAAVPLAAGGLVLMFWSKVTASVTRLTRSENGEVQARHPLDDGERQADELIRMSAESSDRPTGSVTLGLVASVAHAEATSGALKPDGLGWVSARKLVDTSLKGG